jgi:hypothetical protein
MEMEMRAILMEIGIARLTFKKDGNRLLFHCEQSTQQRVRLTRHQ